MLQLNENLIAVLDVETNGREIAYHEILQVAVLVLEPVTLEPHPNYAPFYQNIRPQHPHRTESRAMEVNGLDLEELKLAPGPDEVAEALYSWFCGLNLPLGKRLIPLCQNSPFDIGHMQHWLGIELFGQIFSRRGRDTMYTAAAISDSYSFKGFATPFHDMGLQTLCNYFGIDIVNHHDSLSDCVATAKVYRELLRMEHP